MNFYRPSCVMAVALMATQVLGPAVLWAADQRGIRIEANRRVVVAALSGEQLTVQHNGDSTALHFRDAVNAGDHITTGDRTVADVLIGNRAVVTLGQGTAAQLITVDDEQATLQISHGLVRVAAAPSVLGTQGRITIQTPTGQVQTRGGIIRVLVDQPAGVAEYAPIGESKLYLASYSSSTVVAAVTPRTETIQVEEGSAEILAGAEGKAVTVPAGQTVTIQSGQAGPLAKWMSQDRVYTGILATAGHSQTPKEGVDNLVGRQVAQATALGNALTGAAESGQGDAGKKSDTKNVINGATGGVPLTGNTSSVPPLIAALFNNDGISSRVVPQVPVNKGSATNNGDTSDGANGLFESFRNELTRVSESGGEGLLVYTRHERPVTSVSCDISADCAGLTIKADNNGNEYGLQVLKPQPSVLTAKQELLLIDGGSLATAPHGGTPPSKDDTLILRGIRDVPPSLDGPGNWGPGSGSNGFPLKEDFVQAFEVLVRSNGTTSPSTAPYFKQVSGGTLGSFSTNPDLPGVYYRYVESGGGQDARQEMWAPVITARGNVTLTGGVTLDKGTDVTIGKTTATNTYFGSTNFGNTIKEYTGSLLSVIGGASGQASLTMQNRILGVFDGSKIAGASDKALLSVLDAQLTAPSSVPLIDVDAAAGGTKPTVNVGSAVVIRANALDAKLLGASAPLLALTKATMTTTGNFADLAGTNNKIADLRLSDALVALSASTLTINGNLLSLNAATATINGYLFSLTGGSSLTINSGGALFSLNNGSSLNLTANAFGVFGGNTLNMLKINNDLCGAGSACGLLVNAAGTPFTLLDGTTLQVAGTTSNVVLPNDFNVFALAPGALAPKIDIGTDDALFHVDPTSTLTINETKVQ